MKKLSLVLFVMIFVLFGCSSSLEEANNTTLGPISVATGDDNSFDDTSSNTSNDSNSDNISNIDDIKDPDELPKTENKYSNDKFLVGSDIPAGEYFITVEETGEGSYAIFENAQAEGVIAFSVFENNAFVSVEEGQYIELVNAYGVPIAETPNMVPEDGTYNTGMYRVGIDIPAGIYVATVDDDSEAGIYTISNDMNATDIAVTGGVRGDSIIQITLEEGQYLNLHHSSVSLSRQ